MHRDLPTHAPTLPELTRHLASTPGELVHAVLRDGDHLTTMAAMAPTDLDLLVGFRAPPSWHGVAVVARGATVRVVGTPPDESPEPDGAGPFGTDQDDLVVAVAVDRTGAVAATSLGHHHTWTGHGTDEVDGFVVDLCRRILALECPPERRHPVELALVQWLTLVLDLAADPETAAIVATWDDIATLHPAWIGERCSPVELGVHAVEQTRRWSWEALRLGAARGDLDIEGVAPHVAAWMDAPFLARYLLGTYRAATELLDDLRLFLPDDLHLAVGRVVVATLGPPR